MIIQCLFSFFLIQLYVLFRRMFPTVRVSFSGLEPNSRYAVLMDILPLDKKRYRYAYHRSSWLVAGKADPPPPCRLCMHPDGIFSSDQLYKQTVSFEKVKLTNNAQDKNGQVRECIKWQFLWLGYICTQMQSYLPVPLNICKLPAVLLPFEINCVDRVQLRQPGTPFCLLISQNYWYKNNFKKLVW